MTTSFFIESHALNALALIFLAGLTTCARNEAEDCHQTALIQGAMNICAREDARKAAAELTAVYDKLMTKISPEGRHKLRAAEEAWLSYRRQECEFETLGTRGGSVHPMIVSGCYARMTIEQTKNLRYQLDCEEGDLSCVRQ